MAANSACPALVLRDARLDAALLSMRASPHGVSILPRRRDPVHALEVARVDRLALAQDDGASLFGERDRDAADRLHQRTPAVRVRAAERARGLLRIDGLARAVLGDQAKQNRLDGARVGTRRAFGLHAGSHRVFAADAQGRWEFFAPGLSTAGFLQRN